jgi:glycosyltransferase involved in cell wall biosynthesis
MRRALDGWRPDAMLVYQPQVAAIADVWHVEYLSRAARNARAPRRPGLRGVVEDVQAAGVAVLEDRYLRRLPMSTRVLFCSDGLRDQFSELYGPPPNSGVLYNPALLQRPASDVSLPDPARRAALIGDHAGPVVGFLGGGDPRKGGDLVVDAVAAEPELFLLHAGPSPLDDARIRSRSRGMGHLHDVTELLDVVDVLLVPSRFEPFGLVVVEAAARGVPVLVGPGVGAAPLVLAEDAGEVWLPGTPLGPEVRRLMARRAAIAENGARVLARIDPQRLADQLFADLAAAADRNRATR